MPRHLILGTAGHIDHGKTSLVKALTGIDCDRLPEEKARGITIDIGFAHLDLDGYRLGIVDVPGHERFIRNMLAGATGIDMCLLVVAADDSVMPQTREHLEILQLLGLQHGVVALTKTDLVDETTREVTELEVRELVQGTFLESAPIVATSAVTGAGLDRLKQELLGVCRRIVAKQSHEPFRMAIDRAFVVQGHGTVVTGSVTSGVLRVGDEVEWLPAGERLRVRSLQNHEQPVEEVRRGMRAAINLAGLRHEAVRRGQEVATPGYLQPSRILTVRLHCLRDAPTPVRHRYPVHVHIGTGEVMGRIALLDCDRLDPGGWALAQVFLDEPVVAVWGQPFVVRTPAATATLGGGHVLQPTARKIRRRHLEVLERVERLWTGSPSVRVLEAAWFCGIHGVRADDLYRLAGIGLDEAPILVEQSVHQGALQRLPLGLGRERILHRDILDDLEQRILAAVARMHDEYPLLTSLDRVRIQGQFDYLGDAELVEQVIERLLRTGRLTGDARRLALPTHKPRLSAAQKKLKERIVASYREAGFAPPDADSFLPIAGGQAGVLKDLLELCVAEGELVPLAEGLYLHAQWEEEMRRRVQEKLHQAGALTVAEIRDLLGTTRKYAVPMCEYLDRIGVTRREGDLRVLAAGAA
ncbi:MAG: selenocysteine-specific translation elongation factor [Gemmataceae bacterium]